MAATFAAAVEDNRPAHVQGDLKVVLGTVAGDSSYTTGGYAVPASLFGLSRIIYIGVNAQTNVVTKVASWVEAAAAHKLMIVSDGGTPAEVASTSDQSAVRIQVQVYGY